jgi:hypothetical protein
MKYTLSDCIEAINQVLNYPSVTYIDISQFFDQAISEINSELRLGLKPISDIYKKSNFKIESLGSHVIVVNEAPITSQALPDTGENTNVWFKDGLIHYKRGNKEFTTKTLYAIHSHFENGEALREVYSTVILGNYAYWTAYGYAPERELNLLDYMPYDWVILFLIPYVCFKYAVRDGDSGASYLDDFQQGFQQLRNAYDIPCFVNLQEQAGKKAYLEDIQSRLPNINIIIPTRAIYEDMKVPRVILPDHGSLFDKGGWGF